ncbi:hypothetical protein FHR83_001490 [Actinoplanes campanulatus]|uniref:Uncharacterized protein n=1 Tax=Actinoplanes campanulatus TaxID=113559 RepID=A0A7W5ACN7_9ACTN|nr:hypothetical protein [Actinoplanes campanulatus]
MSDSYERIHATPERSGGDAMSGLVGGSTRRPSPAEVTR